MLSKVLALVCAVASVTAALANSVTISPVVIEIATARRPAAIQVTNVSDREATFQLEAATWQQVNGKDVYEPSDDLILSPSILVIPPRKSQTFRVLLRGGRPAPVERSYRVILEDIGDETAKADASENVAVAIKLRHNLPVLVAPSGKIVNTMRWQPCAAIAPGIAPPSSPPDPAKSATAATGAAPTAQPTPEACVRLQNSGNRRIKVQTLTLTGDGWQQSLALKTGENVLAGADREWRVPLLPGQSLAAVRGVQVQTAESGVITAEAGGF